MLSLYNAKISNFLLFCSHAVCVKHMQPYVYMIPSLSQCVHYLFIVSVKNNIRINNQVCRNCLDDTDAHFTRTTKLCIGYKTKSQWKAPYSQQAIVCISGNCFSCFFQIQCQMDSFRLVRYEMSTGKSSCGVENILLQQRHNAAPGMILVSKPTAALAKGCILCTLHVSRDPTGWQQCSTKAREAIAVGGWAEEDYSKMLSSPTNPVIYYKGTVGWQAVRDGTS